MIPDALRFLARRGAWQQSCRAGAPVHEESCAGLDCDSVPLPSLRSGQTGVVSCLDAPASPAAARLAALGVLPGTRITLVQRSPAVVFRIGFAEFAVDEHLAAHVRLRLD
jgi:Fe2+ transport system protein FeoA